ncbi:MAG: hypothetical protein KJZ54_02245 [Phycisphaerales bacterium]|nr:hypothetical protein [Phycisphaerales bacterium]
MLRIDQAAIAVAAAGIADSLASIKSYDAERVARFERVVEEYDGHVGIMERIAEAAEVMERFRVRHGAGAMWGGDLPYLYDVWDAIARALWTKLGTEPIDRLVESAIVTVMNAEAA